MKHLILFENFDPENIINSTFEDLVNQESLNYLYACLDKVAKACAKESKFLPTREPIDEILRVIKEYANFYSINITGRYQSKKGYLDLQTCLKDSYDYLKALDKHLYFTSDVNNTPSNIIKPTGYLKNSFENGFNLIQNILDEFKIHWTGKVGEAPITKGGGQSTNNSNPGWA